MRDFRKLEVWKQTVEFVTKVYEVTQQFPANEQYGLISQMNRSAVSISANIAEGCSRKTAADFARFLEIAVGSSFELETYFEIALNLCFIKISDKENLINELNIIQKRINKI